jgi:hypothetical protein
MVRIYSKAGMLGYTIPTIFAATTFITILCTGCGRTRSTESNLNYGDTITIDEIEENGETKEIVTKHSHTPSGKKVTTTLPSVNSIQAEPISHHQTSNSSVSADESSVKVEIEIVDELDILKKINNPSLNDGSWWGRENPMGQPFIALARSLHGVTATTGHTAYLDMYNLERQKIANIIAEVEALEQNKAALSPAQKMRLVYLYNQLIQILNSSNYVKDKDPKFVSTKSAAKLKSELGKDKIDAGGISANPKTALTVSNVAANYANELNDLRTYLSTHATGATNPHVVNMIEMTDAILTNNPGNLAKHESQASQIYEGVKKINGLSIATGTLGLDRNRNRYVDTMKVVVLTIPNAKYPGFYAEKSFAISAKKA